MGAQEKDDRRDRRDRRERMSAALDKADQAFWAAIAAAYPEATTCIAGQLFDCLADGKPNNLETVSEWFKENFKVSPNFASSDSAFGDNNQAARWILEIQKRNSPFPMLIRMVADEKHKVIMNQKDLPIGVGFVILETNFNI